MLLNLASMLLFTGVELVIHFDCLPEPVIGLFFSRLFMDTIWEAVEIPEQQFQLQLSTDPLPLFFSNFLYK